MREIMVFIHLVCSINCTIIPETMRVELRNKLKYGWF